MARSVTPIYAAKAKVKPERLLLTAKEVAARAGCSDKHVRNQANAGLLPHVRLGNRILFNPNVLQSFFQQQAASN